MKRTFLAKESEISRTCYLVDAKDKILGRVASKVAAILRGKHKTIFTPHLDTGDMVVVINAGQIRVTGRKLTDKTYQRYSGYPGGKKEIPLEDMLAKRPTEAMKLAVTRMLPRGPLGFKMRKKLHVYAGDQHPHSAQKPTLLEV